MAEINLVGFDNWSKLFWQGFFTFWWNHMILSQNRRFQFDICGAMGPLGRFLTYEYFQQEMEDHENQNLHGWEFQFTRLRKCILMYMCDMVCCHEYSSSTAWTSAPCISPQGVGDDNCRLNKTHSKQAFHIINRKKRPIVIQIFCLYFLRMNCGYIWYTDIDAVEVVECHPRETSLSTNNACHEVCFPGVVYSAIISSWLYMCFVLLVFSPMGPMGLVYLPKWMVDFYGFHVGRLYESHGSSGS